MRTVKFIFLRSVKMRTVNFIFLRSVKMRTLKFIFLRSVKMRTVNFMAHLSKIERVTVNRDEPLKRRTSLKLKKFLYT